MPAEGIIFACGFVSGSALDFYDPSQSLLSPCAFANPIHSLVCRAVFSARGECGGDAVGGGG